MNNQTPENTAEPLTQPKFIFPDLQNNPGGMMFVPELKQFWIGLDLKVADYTEACAIIDGAKLQLLNHYKTLNQKRILSPGNAAQAMKQFVLGKFGI